jgi:cysteine desulfurase
MDERVFEAMKPYFLEFYGNPQSIYSLGAESKNALEQARENVASLINAQSSEIIFTSCATESNNLALKGIAAASKDKGKHIIVSEIEHFSVLNAAKRLQKEGFEITFVGVDKNGFIKAADLRKALRADTILVSIQYANPEVGAIQNIKKLSQIVKSSSSAIFHTDAVCACGFEPVDVQSLGIDSLTFTASTMYGPKGAAALYLKKGIKMSPLFDGGVQERSKRSGTENIPAIVGFGEACLFAKAEMAQNAVKIRSLRDILIKELPKRIEYIYLNGPTDNRLPGNVNFSIEFVEGEALFMLLDSKGIMAASGSACASKDLNLSHVLKAMGVDVAIAQGSIIWTLSKYNDLGDIDYILEQFPPIVKRLRDMSPLYSHFVNMGTRKEAGPGTDYDHHDHEIGEEN